MWNPGDDGEMVPKVKILLELVHDEWEPTGPGPQMSMLIGDKPGDEARKNKRIELS